MGRDSNKKYRSYREKKTQSKKFRTYFIRIILMFLFYSLFTVFVAISIQISGDSMSPNLNSGNAVIMTPTNNIFSIFKANSSKIYKRGEAVFTSTNYTIKPSLIEKIIDPIVRIFTLQKKSLIYDNSNYKGRGEILRVVGIPGDTIKMKDSTIYIKAADEEFFLSEFELSTEDYDINKNQFSPDWKESFPFSSESGELYIPENNYFLISDNRGTNNDSRIYGSVDKKDIIGKISIKYWPINEFTFY